MIHLNAIVSVSHLEPRERATAPVGRRLVLRLVIDAHAQYEEQMLAHHFHLAEQTAPSRASLVCVTQLFTAARKRLLSG